MKAQNIMSQAVSSFAGMAKDATTKKVSAVSEDNQFSSVMNRNMKKDNDVSNAPQSEQNVAGTKVNNQKPVQTNKPEETVEKTATDTQVTEASGTETSPETEVAAVQEEIKQAIKDVTGMTDEELAEMLSQYNLAVTDLLDFSTLQQFVVAVNGGEDVSILLTDETAAEQFASLYEQLKDLSEAMQSFMSDETMTADAEVSSEMLATQLMAGDSVIMPEDGNNKKVFADAMDAAEEMTDNVQADAPVIMVEAEEGYNYSGSSPESDDEFASEQASATDEQIDIPQMKESPVAVFAQNLANAANQANQTASVAESSHVQQMMDIVNQVVEQIKITLKPDTTSMDMMLNPESLGRLQLTVESKGGVMTANFTVQNEVAKEAIESQIQVLREQLDEKNIKVDAVEVNVSDFDFEGSSMAEGEAEKQGSKQSSANQRKLLNLDSLDETEETLTEEEELAVEVMKQNGSSIDFTA